MKEQETSSKSLQILDLPPEIVFKIFSLISTQDLLLNVALVSKSFHAIVKNPLVHRTVMFSPYCSGGFHKVQALKFLRKCVLMKELIIKWDETAEVFPVQESFREFSVDEFLSELVFHHDQLRVIDVCKRQTIVSTTCLATMGRASWWKKLEKISLTLGPIKNPLARAGLIAAVEKLTEARSLQHLDVKIPSKYLNPIVLASKNLTTLKNLTTSNHDDFEAIINVIKLTIKDLEIVSDLRPESFELISSCQHLESLSIRSELFKNLEMLTKLENLRHLEFPVGDSIRSGILCITKIILV